jgi:hypothetical protein
VVRAESDGPRVSVVLPTYNRGHLVSRAIDSALRALSSGDEIVVVDDGSTDDTASVVGRYGEPVRYVRTENRGAGAARNTGVQIVAHDWIAFLDSDDEWRPDRLRLGRAVLTALPDVLFCFSSFGARRSDGSEHGDALVSWHGDTRSWDQILGPGVPFSSLAPLPEGRPDFLVHTGSLYTPEMAASYVNVNTLLVRRAQAGEALRFPEGLATFEDWECVGRLASRGRAAYLACDTAWQWVHREPRLTNADVGACATARLAVLAHVWGSDRDFLAVHGERYRAVVREQHLLRARSSLRQAPSRLILNDLRHAGHAPMVLWILAVVPRIVRRALTLLTEMGTPSS